MLLWLKIYGASLLILLFFCYLHERAQDGPLAPRVNLGHDGMGRSLRPASEPLISQPKLTKRRAFPWIRKTAIAHTSSWATRIGRSPCRFVKTANKWFFDGKAGLQELLYRRIGANELDAIQICRGYVEAQYDYAYK